MPDRSAKKFQLGDIASRRDPRRAPWGYYCCDDSLFGIGLFLWFTTKERLLQFLAEHEGSDSESQEQDVLRSGMRKIVLQISAGRLGLEMGRQRFNAVLKSHLQIEWMGHFDEMLSGQHPFSKKVRTQFLQLEDQPTVPAITPTQVKDFIEELRSYGH
jgi:hypothetical protein